MLYRKIEKEIETHLMSDDDRIMIIEGARQVGKSYSIRNVGQHVFPNFVELNFVEDDEGKQIFKNIATTEEFYLNLSMIAGDKLDTADNTLIFLDEIQHYPQFLTLLKFLRQERRYKFIASGSLLGLSLRTTTSIPVGSIIRKNMMQLDFEEFLIANGVGREFIDYTRKKYEERVSLSDEIHKQLMNHFRRYLLVGGMPDAVSTYLSTHNIVKVRDVQTAIINLYSADAAKYEHDNGRNLLIQRIYGMIPSQMENKKKRMVVKDIQGKHSDRFSNYQDEFEYLISAGITLDTHAISNPHYPLAESAHKNLVKLYMNDVGMLTALLYKNNLQPILGDEKSVNLGSVYENVVAQELRNHGCKLFYYDNRQHGEVDFIIDDYNSTSILPIEVKSGKDYTIHSALNRMLSVSDYHVTSAIVLSNEREVKRNGGILYMPIYYIMFINADSTDSTNVYF